MVPLVARTETEEPGLAAEASHTLGQDRAVFAPALRRENRRLGFVGQSFGHVFENRNGLRVADVSAGFARLHDLSLNAVNLGHAVHDAVDFVGEKVVHLLRGAADFEFKPPVRRHDVASLPGFDASDRNARVSARVTRQALNAHHGRAGG